MSQISLQPPALGESELPVPDRPPLVRSGRRTPGADAVMEWLTRSAAVVIILMLVALLGVLTHAAMPSIHSFGLGFLTNSTWRPNALEQAKRTPDGKLVRDASGEVVNETLPAEFGALPVIYGTAVSSLIALIVAVPLSLGAALFLVRICPRWLGAPVSFLIEFLAAIPSIAYGIWGLFVLAPFLQGNVRVWDWLSRLVTNGQGQIMYGVGWLFESLANPPTSHPSDVVVQFRGVEPILESWLIHVPGMQWMFHETFQIGTRTIARQIPLTGRDMFSGGLVLGIMVIPIITAIGRDVLKAVPRAQIEGTLALGATWWQSCRAMLRYGRAGLFGAVMLGLARASGETMAVTMVIGNNNQIRSSIFAPAQTMSSLLANEFAEASTAMHTAALAEVALVLLVMSLIFNVGARYLVVGKGSRTAMAQ
jgi:phosphate transport system permease protein